MEPKISLGIAYFAALAYRARVGGSYPHIMTKIFRNIRPGMVLRCITYDVHTQKTPAGTGVAAPDVP